MPTVSILIPAFRPTYLQQTIQSALDQTFTDTEILVGDDCPDDSVRRIVESFQDSRLRYLPNPTPRRPGTNRDNLLQHSTAPFIKFLFDDDWLLPWSIQALVDLAERTGAALCFHERHLVDEQGRVTDTFTPLFPGTTALLDAPSLISTMLNPNLPMPRNWIGEPTVVLLRREVLDKLEHPFGIECHSMHFLTDVTCYWQVTRVGGAAGVGAVLGVVRQHTQRTSAERGPLFAAGHFEWEVLVRWAFDNGLVDEALATSAIARLRARYAELHPSYPELAPLLGIPIELGLGMHGNFKAALKTAWQILDDKLVPHQPTFEGAFTT